jgi:hypothetical protein
MSSLPPSRVAIANSLAIAGALACSKAPPAQAPEPVERTALVAQTCPELELDPGPLDPTNARAFVEVVEVSTRDLPTPLGRWLDENSVKVRASVNLVAFPDVPTSTPWGQCVDAVCGGARRALTVTARLPEQGAEPLTLALRIDEIGAEGRQPAVLLDTTVSAEHQQPVLVPNATAVSAGSLVLTAYVLRRHDDLQRVMACRAQQAEKEKQLR